MIDFSSIIFSRDRHNRQSLAWQSELVLPKPVQSSDFRKDESAFVIFRDLISGLFEAQGNQRVQERFSVHANRALVGFASIVDGEWGGQIMCHRREHIRKADANFVRVKLQIAGSSISTIKGYTFFEKGPVISLIDYSQPWKIKTTRFRASHYYLPHEAIGYDPSRHPPQIVVPLNTPKGRVLGDFMRTSVQELLESAHSLNVPIVAGAAHLFRAMLLEEVDEEGQHKFQEARAVAMRKFLADRVRDPSLGIEQLMGAFGASRATIFRDFEPYGGVSHFVAEERVKGVALDLMKRTPDRGAVLRVSEEWGFSSPHMFSRFFRKHLGMAPSEVLGLRRGEF